MATPIGHALIGAAAYLGTANPRWLDPKVLGLAIALANSPDLDILLGLAVGDTGRYHHDISHSLVMGAVVSFVVVIGLKSFTGWFSGYRLLRLLLLANLFFGTHLLLDLVTLDNSAPHGMPLFWPFSDTYVDLPVYLIPNVLHSVESPFSIHNVGVAARELLIFVPLLIALVLINTGVAQKWRVSAIFVAIALTGVVLGALLTSNPYY